MAKNINYLPYLRVENPDKTKGREIDNFLARKFRKGISTICPLHYYLTPSTKDVLKFIKATSKKYHYFLRLDIKHYYPSISHKVLLQKLPQIHQALFQKNSSRRLKRVFEKEIPVFLKSISFGLPVSSRLSRTLAALFLLDLDLKIKNPFLRQVDDYLIFCRNKKEAEEILDKVVLPKLKELNLSLNQKKLRSGRFHQDKVDFLGFEFLL